jgi:hypothetical protein
MHKKTLTTVKTYVGEISQEARVKFSFLHSFRFFVQPDDSSTGPTHVARR